MTLDYYLPTHSLLPWHLGGAPDQLPASTHIRVFVPLSKKPSLHVYVATEPVVVLMYDTLPFRGSSRSPHPIGTPEPTIIGELCMFVGVPS